MRARQRSERRAVADLERQATMPKRANPLTTLWRFRWELTTVAATIAAAYAAIQAAGPLGVTLLPACAASLAAIPAVRSLVTGWAWCVITAHRVRVACRETRIHSRSGRLPTILNTRRIDGGERVLLWCPAGVSVEDFTAAAPTFSAACFAREVTASVHPKYAHLVTLYIRRSGTPRPPDRIAGGGQTRDVGTAPPTRSGIIVDGPRAFQVRAI